MNCLYFAEEVLRNELNKMLVKFTVLIELKSRSFIVMVQCSWTLLSL